MIGRLRRIKCTNCPMPIEAVSPSPLTPSAIRLRFASIAPVATDGMRPCTELKLCERLMKYAGLFDEHPMPLSLATFSGFTPISNIASMMRSEIALWPQPAQSVVFPPLYSRTERLMRFVLGAGVLGVVDILLALHRHDFVGDRAGVERQPVNVSDTAQPRCEFGAYVELQQAQHLRIAILFDHVEAVMLLNELVNLARERIRLQP